MFHKEGYTIIISSFLIIALIILGMEYYSIRHSKLIATVLLILLVLILQFFRNPKININSSENYVLSPADGKIVIIKKVFEPEFFKDERMQYFGKKILYEESPQSLPKDEYETVHKEVASRILSTNKENWNTIPRTYSEIDTLRNKFKDDKEKLKALKDINAYIEEMEKMYQKAS